MCTHTVMIAVYECETFDAPVYFVSPTEITEDIAAARPFTERCTAPFAVYMTDGFITSVTFVCTACGAVVVNID